jgi:hypothetical protein
MNKKTFWTLTIGLATVKLLIHLLTCTNYELHRDEMLYFAMGSHLSWGYASTPPFMALLAFHLKNIFGYEEFFVKLFPALAGSSILVLIALFIRELKGNSFAVFTGSLACLISTSMLRSGSLFMPVIFELFFWMLILFFVLKLVNRQDPRYWMVIGLCVGLAFLNKYSVAFLGLSIFVSSLITPHRKLLNSKYLLFGALISACIMLPNLIWQFTHNFPVMTHMEELYRTQLVFVSKKTFLLEQVMMNFTAISIWLIGLICLLVFKSEKKYRLFAWIFLLVIFLFLITNGKPYYTLGVYPVLFAFGGYYLEKFFTGRLKPISYLVVAVSFLFSLLFLPLGLPLLPQKQMENYCAFFSKNITSAPMRSENNSYFPLPQDYMDMTGWKELSKMVGDTYQNLDSLQKKSCVIFANNYGQAGAIDFYGKEFNLPSPVCLNDSYIFWAPDSLSASTFIVMDHKLGDIPDLFFNYHEISKINNRYFREDGLTVFLCENTKPLFKDFFTKRITEHKRIYGKQTDRRSPPAGGSHTGE